MNEAVEFVLCKNGKEDVNPPLMLSAALCVCEVYSELLQVANVFIGPENF